MDLLPVSSAGPAEAARPAGARSRTPGGPAFGAALDSAMTDRAARKEAARDADLERLARKEAAEAREDDERAAEQAALWMTAARAARSEPRPLRPRAESGDAPAGAEAAADAASKSGAAPNGEPGPLPADAESIARAAEVVAAAEAKAVEAGATASARPATRRESVHAVERSLEALDPAFRAKLERVIERMEAAGHDVTVTETHRDADRQNFLFEQGRTRPGPVVTWTRNSNHSRGVAADLVVDGTYDNPAGYAKLARIAAEEGLRTLGARDQGHVELGGAGIQAPRAAVQSAQPPIRQAAAPAVQPQAVAAQGGIAQVAQIAQPAQVAQVVLPAQVAQVAQVAQPAQPGSWSVRTPEFLTGAQADGDEAAAVAQAALSTDPTAVAREAVRGFAAASVRALGGRGKADDDGAAKSGDVDLAALAGEGGTERVPFVVAGAAGGRAEAAGGVAPALRADVAGRMERVLALQDAAAEQPLSQVSVMLEGDDGTATRVHVGLRGSTVGASIDSADPLAAASMRAHVAELRQALEQKGLDPSALLVRTAAKPAESVDASRLLASLAKADPTLATLTTGTARENSAQRDSSGQGQSHNQPARRDPDAQRQRHSRNGKEDRP